MNIEWMRQKSSLHGPTRRSRTRATRSRGQILGPSVITWTGCARRWPPWTASTPRTSTGQADPSLWTMLVRVHRRGVGLPPPSISKQAACSACQFRADFNVSVDAAAELLSSALRPLHAVWISCPSASRAARRPHHEHRPSRGRFGLDIIVGTCVCLSGRGYS